MPERKTSANKPSGGGTMWTLQDGGRLRAAHSSQRVHEMLKPRQHKPTAAKERSRRNTSNKYAQPPLINRTPLSNYHINSEKYWRCPQMRRVSYHKMGAKWLESKLTVKSFSPKVIFMKAKVITQNVISRHLFSEN